MGTRDYLKKSEGGGGGRGGAALTAARAKAALAVVLRRFAAPVRKALERGPGPSQSLDDGWLS